MWMRILHIPPQHCDQKTVRRCDSDEDAKKSRREDVKLSGFARFELH